MWWISADYFQSPFDRGDYNGSEKHQTACHADLLFRFMVDGTVEEGQLWRMFKDSQLYPARAPDQESGKRRVPNPARKLFTANLCEPPIPLQEAAKMRLDDWKMKAPTAKWRAFYFQYVVPLGKLSRLLRQVTTTRATDKHATELADQYMRGSRLVFGVDFMLSKTIYHRTYHILTQPEGKAPPYTTKRF